MWFWKNKAAPLVLAVAILTLVLPQNLLSATPAKGGGLSSFTSEAYEPYKVGALFAATGFNAALGNPQMQTVEMMVEQINASGGIGGHPLEVIAYDYESDAAKCSTLADKLINDDNVTAIIGPTGTGDTNAILDMAKDAEIPLISCAAGKGIVTPYAAPATGNDRHWIFSTPQVSVMVVQRLYEYLSTENISRIAIITDTAGFGADGRNHLKGQAATYGITITADQTYGASDADMLTQLTLIEGTNPQALVCWGQTPGSAIVAKNMTTLGMRDIPLFCSHAITLQSFTTLASDSANGVMLACGKLPVADYLPDSNPQKALLLDYRTGFDAEYGVGTANTFGGHAYDALSIVVEALKNAVDEDPATISGSQDVLQAVRAEIRDYVEGSINSSGYPGTGGYPGIAGVFNMSLDNHNGLSKDSLVMIKIVDGDWTLLSSTTPPTVATNTATSVTSSGATLNGNLGAMGTASAVQVSFEYGDSTSYGSATADQAMAASGAFNASLTGLKCGTVYHFRARAVGDGAAYGGDQTFTTGACPTTPPTVATNSATGVTSSGATLNGDLTSLGTASSATVSYVWGTTTGSYPNETTGQVMTSNGAFYSDSGSLTPGTTYYYKAKAVGDGTSYGGEKSFTTVGTAPTLPTVATNDASSITTSSARLNGNVTSLGTAGSVTVSFVWGTTTGSYPNETTGQAMTSNGAFYFDQGSLSPGTTYYYKAKAVGDGTSYGDEKSFTTVGTAPTPPTVATNDASTIATASARLNGDLTSLGTASGVTVSFVWGTSSGSHPNETTGVVKTGTGAFYFDQSSLTPGTTYYYKAKAVGHGDAVYGVEKSFITRQSPVINSVDPDNGKRKEELTVTISGANFDGATSLSFGDSITVAEFSIVSNTQITAEIAIGAKAAKGMRDVSVTTAWGTATKTDGFAVIGGGGGICSGGAPITPGAPSEMTTTLAALGLLLGLGYLFARRSTRNRRASVRA